mgnify:CR=1 FL=1
MLESGGIGVAVVAMVAGVLFLVWLAGSLIASAWNASLDVT